MERTFVVAATGPSLALSQVREIALAATARTDVSVIAVNDAVYPLWFADIAYACDAAWWRYHRGLPRFAGWRLKLFVPNKKTGEDENAVEFEGIDDVVCTGTDGFDPTPGHVRSGGNSGYQAMQVAVHLGAARIVLVGFDMRVHGRHRHWFGEHPAQIRKTASLERWVSRFYGLARALDDHGVEVLNASPGSALTMFRSVDLSSALW